MLSKINWLRSDPINLKASGYQPADVVIQKDLASVDDEHKDLQHVLEKFKNKIPYLFIEEPYDYYNYELSYGNAYGGSGSGGEVDHESKSSAPGISTWVEPFNTGQHNPY